MKYSMYLTLLVMVVSFTAASQNNPQKRYTKVSDGWLMVLLQGDNILNQLESFAKTENIPSANFTGMGFVNIKFGFFNFDTKEYEPKEFQKVELASMHGTIAWQDGKPSIHAHGVVTGRDFTAHGGHILEASVSTGSVEIMITVHDKKLQRIKDPQIGANVLQLTD